MPTCTPIYRLPYTVGSDPVCDIHETFCAFAVAVEAELDRLDGIVDRVVDSVPMVRVRLTVPYPFSSASNTTISVPFDTVDVDTADMIDTAADPTLITLPRPGIYAAAFQVAVTPIAVGDTFSADLVNAMDTYHSDTVGPGFVNSGQQFRYSPTPGAFPRDTLVPEVRLDVNVLVGNFTITSAAASIYYLGDLP